MALTGQRIRAIRQALLDGFPKREHLEMMLRVQMDVNLDAVAESDDQTLRIYKLITWADRMGNVRTLIAAAAAENPNNPVLAALVAESRNWLLDHESAVVVPMQPQHETSTLGGDSDTERAAYLDHLYTRYRTLDFKGMGMADRVALQLPIEQMYVPLSARMELPRGETWDRKKQRIGMTRSRDLLLAGRLVTDEEATAIGEWLSEPMSVPDLLQRNQGLVLLGDPGAGKTTFLKYLTVKLALDEGHALGLGGRLPVLVPLSAYANALTQHDIALQDFVADYYHVRGIDVSVGQLIRTALEQGLALIMLDGLDEVQSLKLRTMVVERVESFGDYHCKQGNKLIVTSRIVGYRDVRLSAQGLRECTLIDFNEDDIALFLDKWTQAIEQMTQGSSLAARLDAAEEKAEMLFALERNPGVRQLASNPLLLTILALMKRQGVILPDRRVQLYEQYVHTLLRHWNLSRGLDRRFARDPDTLTTIRVLAPLALWMQETSPGAGLVRRGAVQRQLQAIYAERNAPDPEQAAWQFLSDVRDYASLLLERGAGEYGFIHLTFQEYLAAVAVAQKGQSDLSPVIDLLLQHIVDPTWREVLLLAIGYMGIVQQRDEAASEVLLRLIKRNPGEPGSASVFAGEAVLDTWPGGVTTQARAEIIEELVRTVLDNQAVNPKTRTRAGSVLGALGDPRDLEQMIGVPAGSFLMGSSRYEGKYQEFCV